MQSSANTDDLRRMPSPILRATGVLGMDVNARAQAQARDELARRRVAKHERERQQEADRYERTRTLEARLRQVEKHELPKDRDELEALREQLIERLEQVEELLVVPGKHWQRRAA